MSQWAHGPERGLKPLPTLESKNCVFLKQQYINEENHLCSD